MFSRPEDLDELPLGTGESAKRGVVADDLLLHLILRGTTQNPELGQLFQGRVLQPQRLGVGAERLRDGPAAQQL